MGRGGDVVGPAIWEGKWAAKVAGRGLAGRPGQFFGKACIGGSRAGVDV